MTRNKFILWSLLIAAAIPAAATEHYSISPLAVAATISGMGVAVSPDQISFPSGVVATTQAPQLKVRSVEKLNDARFLVRLECASSDECLPFLVNIRAGQGSGDQIAALNGASSVSHPGTPVVRSGSTVMLMLDSDHMQIRIPAICLQGGAPGQLIRVSDTNHRLIYAAQVVDAATVKGKLR
jgi:hypothetical protein